MKKPQFQKGAASRKNLGTAQPLVIRFYTTMFYNVYICMSGCLCYYIKCYIIKISSEKPNYAVFKLKLLLDFHPYKQSKIHLLRHYIIFCEACAVHNQRIDSIKLSEKVRHVNS